MNVQLEKMAFLQQYIQLQDMDLIKKLSDVLRAGMHEQYNSDEPDDPKLEAALNEAIESLKRDGGIPHEEVMKRTAKRYPQLAKNSFLEKYI